MRILRWQISAPCGTCGAARRAYAGALPGELPRSASALYRIIYLGCRRKRPAAMGTSGSPGPSPGSISSEPCWRTRGASTPAPLRALTKSPEPEPSSCVIKTPRRRAARRRPRRRRFSALSLGAALALTLPAGVSGAGRRGAWVTGADGPATPYFPHRHKHPGGLGVARYLGLRLAFETMGSACRSRPVVLTVTTTVEPPRRWWPAQFGQEAVRARVRPFRAKRGNNHGGREGLRGFPRCPARGG